MSKRTTAIIFFGIMFTSMSYPDGSFAEVNIDIGINVPLPQVVIPAPPPVVVLHEPPPVVVIPRTYVYYTPDVDVDIFFYHGYWYQPHHGHWYRAKGYSGPWAYIAPDKVPGVLFGLPPDFRHSPYRHQYIAHEQLKKNWKAWEKEKHWDKYEYADDRRETRSGEHREDKHHRDKGKKHDQD
jgi:hypothetical protein